MDSSRWVLLILCLLALAGAAAEPPPVVPGLLLALPKGAAVQARWVCPPQEAAAVKASNWRDLCFVFAPDGTPWLLHNDTEVVCPTKGYRFTASRSLAQLLFLDDGALLAVTDNTWGYLVPTPAPKTSAATSMPRADYQPIAPLPLEKCTVYAGQDRTLFFAGSNPATGMQEVYQLRLGEGAAALQGYVPIFTTVEQVTAVSGDRQGALIVQGDLITSIMYAAKDGPDTFKAPGQITGIAYREGSLFYTTSTRVGILAPGGSMEIAAVKNPVIAQCGETLYIGLPDSLGVLALDKATDLARFNLSFTRVWGDASPTLAVTGLRFFMAGPAAPPLGERTFAATFARQPGQMVYAQVDVNNRRPGTAHQDVVGFELTSTEGLSYYVSSLTFDVKADYTWMAGWVPFGTAQYPLYPGTYTARALLTGAVAASQTFTVEGDVTVPEAVAHCDVRRLKELLARGGDANAVMSDTQTPVLLVAVTGALCGGIPAEERQARVVETVRLLLKHKADIKARDPKTGETALHRAAGVYWDAAEVVKVLLKAGAEVNARDTEQNTPLHCAMRFGTLATARALLEKGADPNARTKDGMTVLKRATWIWNDNAVPIFELLLANGANPNAAEADGETPLIRVVRDAFNAHAPAFAQALIRVGANVNASYKLGTGTCSVLGSALLNYAYLSPRSMPESVVERAGLVMVALRAAGARLLPEEERFAFIGGRYRWLDAAQLEEILVRRPELLADTEYTDDLTVQTAAIRCLLAMSRARVAKAAGAYDYLEALKLATDAKARMEKYFRPRDTWMPEVYYNCGLLAGHLGRWAEAKTHFSTYLELAPAAKDAKQVRALIAGYTAQETALSKPPTAKELTGIWYPDSTDLDRMKYYRIQIEPQGNGFVAHALTQPAWGTAVPASPAVPVKIVGEQLIIEDAVFYTCSAAQHPSYGPFTATFTLTRIGENRFIGEVYVRGTGYNTGKAEPLRFTATYEWRRRK